MIPTTLTAAHIRAAIARIQRDGVPRGRQARRYVLLVDGRAYPPKYTVAMAAKLATGTLLDSESFGGGAETNSFLRRLGFMVEEKDARPVSARRSAEVGSTTLRVGRVFLNLGVRAGAYRKMPDGKAAAFSRLVYDQFASDPHAYRARMVGLIEQAHAAGASVVVLPACALQAYGSVRLSDYAVPSVPLVVTGGGDPSGELAAVYRHGVLTERFDARQVHWLDAGSFSIMAAISSTIGQAIESQHEPPVRSESHPPSPNTPVFIVDVGHAQYSSRYDFNTLRCVARDVAARHRQPAGLVLSSWMWSTRGVGERWCHPPERTRVRRLATQSGDHVDLIDVDLSPTSTKGPT